MTTKSSDPHFQGKWGIPFFFLLSCQTQIPDYQNMKKKVQELNTSNIN